MTTATLLSAEHVRLPDGREFTGLTCETDAARALISGGIDPASPLAFHWHDGRPSTRGTVAAYARLQFSQEGTRRWRPHPMSKPCLHLVAWAAKDAAEAKARRGGRGAAP